MTSQLPQGWTGYVNGIATNRNPISGGIIDNVSGDGTWFVIPENDLIPQVEGLETQQDAFTYLEKMAATLPLVKEQ